MKRIVEIENPNLTRHLFQPQFEAKTRRQRKAEAGYMSYTVTKF